MDLEFDCAIGRCTAEKSKGVCLSAAMSEQNGYFAVIERDGIFWLIDPAGRRFLSKGVNNVRFDPDRIQGGESIPYAKACTHKYGDRKTWRADAARRLGLWGFNTLGAWSDEELTGAGPSALAVTPNLDLGMSFASEQNKRSKAQWRQEFPDIFEPNFERHIRRRAEKLCATRRDERDVLGWFIDNELRWCSDWRGPDELLGLFLGMPPASAGRGAAFDWLKQRDPDFVAFNTTWQTPACSWDGLAALGQIDAPYRRDPPYQRRPADEAAAHRADPRRARFAADCDDFAAHVAERYFALTRAAIKAADPHHLVLGARFAYVPPRGVIEAAGRCCDVVSFNCYDVDPGAAIDTYAGTGKPCLIGEFSFRAVDSGLPNTNGAGPLVATQAERAACFRRYVATALRRPAVVGYHWFEHADQPAQGRFDGENSNFGTGDDRRRSLSRTDAGDDRGKRRR